MRNISRFVQLTREEGLLSAVQSTLKFVYNKLVYSKLFVEIRLKRKKSLIEESTDNSIHINYNEKKTRFAELCDKYGTDKGEVSSESNPYPWESHNYSDYYELIFKARRSSTETLLECGIGTNDVEIPSSMGSEANPGASLRVWRDYFYNADIFGVDIDEKILFSEERISTYKLDQTSEDSIERFLDNVEADSFDIIVDDGLHAYHANVCLFENIIHRMSDDGIYIIEDVSYDNVEKYKTYFVDQLDSYDSHIIQLDNPRRDGRKGDRLVMITPK